MRNEPWTTGFHILFKTSNTERHSQRPPCAVPAKYLNGGSLASLFLRRSSNWGISCWMTGGYCFEILFEVASQPISSQEAMKNRAIFLIRRYYPLTGMHIQVAIFTCINIYRYVHIQIHTYIYIYIHMYICTYLYTPFLLSSESFVSPSRPSSVLGDTNDM